MPPKRIRRIFISYSRRNDAWAYNFHAELRQSYDAWIDAHILGASNWWSSIVDEIEECDVFIALLSKPYFASQFCMTELQYAVDLNKPIVPLKIDDFTDREYPKILDQKSLQYLSNLSYG
jgi:hypothetical protein